jgi:hypothetical protein
MKKILPLHHHLLLPHFGFSLPAFDGESALAPQIFLQLVFLGQFLLVLLGSVDYHFQH